MNNNAVLSKYMFRFYFSNRHAELRRKEEKSTRDKKRRSLTGHICCL